MTLRVPVLLLALLPLASCAATSVDPLAYDARGAEPAYARSSQSTLQTGPRAAPEPPKREWRKGEPLMQGFLGASFFEHVSVDGGSGVEVDGDDGDLDQMPLIGGGGQWKLGGEGIDMGLEGLFSMSWRGSTEAFVVGGGGAAIAIDVDLFLIEFYGGPFVSFDLGKSARLYGAVGPVLQFADYDQEGGGFSDDGSGFGTGFYGRAGIEFELPSRTYIGFGARWSDTTVDLGGALGNLEMDGVQALFTVSRWL